MQITLNNTGKRFNREWIFRYCNYQFVAGNSYAITGANGSGKSTLLQVIAGAQLHNEGSVLYDGNTGADIHHLISIAAPYLELIEEMTALETLQFHEQFKSLQLPIDAILGIVGLTNAANKQLRYFSSGMKQRLKLAQAFFSETPVLLLDEPTTNLDAEGIELYHQLIADYTINRLVIVSSNDLQEYAFCKDILAIGDYKTAQSF